MTRTTSPDDLDLLLQDINKQSILSAHSKQVQQELSAMEYAPTCLLQPAGKRPRDFGLEDGWQGILHAVRINDRRASIKVTYLAAGFVFGDKGQSIQDISERTNVKTQSWCASFSEAVKDVPREVRVWHICGEPDAIYKAVELMSNAVDRYRELIGGKYKDKVVSVQQVVCGIKFVYKPPPIHKMPNSARTVYFCDKPSAYGTQKAALRRVQSDAAALEYFPAAVNFQKQHSTSELLEKLSISAPAPPPRSLHPSPSIPVTSTPTPVYQPQHRQSPQYVSYMTVYQPQYYTPEVSPYSYVPVSMFPVHSSPYPIQNVGHVPMNMSSNMFAPTQAADTYFMPAYSQKYMYPTAC
eukprot:TRINITY_DN10904_c0_g1_i1.p1 TRINITY_DN10904_c0_g1~~TRINITY_DN10904_c0_g1_i1.p1  ORF type:complete len:353 (+),score=26.13 TRINITY_DN10904_c0_g1_i1:207-1265(+)